MDLSELKFGLTWQSNEPELAKEFDIQVSSLSCREILATINLVSVQFLWMNQETLCAHMVLNESKNHIVQRLFSYCAQTKSLRMNYKQ